MIEVVIMGGCMGVGNTGPVMEFNIQVFRLSRVNTSLVAGAATIIYVKAILTLYVSMSFLKVDPEAAKVVFESGVPLTMVPLEVTHTVLATRDVLYRIAGRAAADVSSTSGRDISLEEGSKLAASALSKFRGAIVLLLLYFSDTYFKVFGFSSPPLHDPCAVAFVIAPDLFEVRHLDYDLKAVRHARQFVLYVNV